MLEINITGYVFHKWAIFYMKQIGEIDFHLPLYSYNCYGKPYYGFHDNVTIGVLSSS